MIDYVGGFVCFRWIRDQQIAEGVVPGEDVYIILRLDGRVRRSGKVSLIYKPFLSSLMFIAKKSGFIVLISMHCVTDV